MSGTRRVLTQVFAVSVFGLASQCSSQEKGWFRAEDPAPSVEGRALAQAQCEYLARCDADSVHMFAGSSWEECVDYFSCQVELGDLARVKESVGVKACIDSLTSRDCPNLDINPTQYFAFMGFPWGEGCGRQTIAEYLAAATDAPVVGEACITGFSEHAPCKGDTFCDVASVPLRLGSYKCGTCTPSLALGDACDWNSRCTQGTSCVLGRCAVLIEVGEACSHPEQCRFALCTDGRCARSLYAPKPYAEMLGASCTLGLSGTCGAQGGLYCDEGTCRPLYDEGEHCDTGTPCRLGQVCAENRCVSVGCTVDLREPCVNACEGGECRDNICSPMGSKVGDDCSWFCLGELDCVDSHCAPSTMRAPAAIGGACDFDMDCLSSFCDRDISSYCSGSTCSIPSCDGCGVCADPPTVAWCE
jgi:hypothetical protein